MDQITICPVCQGLGVVLKNVRVDDPDFGKSFPCPNCTVFFDAQLENMKRASRLMLHSQKTFSNFISQLLIYSDQHNQILESALQEAMDYANRPLGWLVLKGGYGVGKTHLAAAIGHVALEKGVRTVFVTVPDLLDHLRATFGPSATTSYDQEFELLSDVELLILDDLGAENSSAWAQEKLYQLINHRYIRRLPTVFTTNLEFPNIEGRISSRLRDVNLSTLVHMELPDFRLQTALDDTEIRALNILTRYSSGGLDTLEDFQPDLEETHLLRQNIDRMVKRQAGFLAIIGDSTDTKAKIAAIVAAHWRNHQHSQPYMVDFIKIMSYLREALSEGNNRKKGNRLGERVALLSQVPLLILDCFSDQTKQSEWVFKQVLDIIDHRAKSDLLTVITVAMTDLPNVRKVLFRTMNKTAEKTYNYWALLSPPGHESQSVNVIASKNNSDFRSQF